MSVIGDGITSILSGGIFPTGNIDITTLNSYDVTYYATAQVSAAERAKVIAGNIKKDVTILGVTGTYEGGGGLVIGNTGKQVMLNFPSWLDQNEFIYLVSSDSNLADHYNDPELQIMWTYYNDTGASYGGTYLIGGLVLPNSTSGNYGYTLYYDSNMGTNSLYPLTSSPKVQGTDPFTPYLSSSGDFGIYNHHSMVYPWLGKYFTTMSWQDNSQPS